MKKIFSKKKLTFCYKLFLIIILSSACYNCQESQAATSPIYLEGLSATSVHLDYETYGPHNVFTKKKYWATMPGAAPNEGLLLRFPKKIYIKKMEILLPDNKDISSIQHIGIVLNGVNEKRYKLKKSIPIRKEVRSIYIRIINTNFHEYKNKRRRYRSNLSSGIQQLIFRGNNDEVLPIYPPQLIRGSINASSTLTPAEAYNTDYLFDSRSEFGWVEGVKGSGKGESLTFSFNNSVQISKLQIWNGYQRSRVHYYANERVKECSFGSESTMDSYPVKDSMTPQVIQLKKPLKEKKFTLKITDIYKGSKYKDCVISELRFFDGEKWFLVNSGEQDKKKQALIRKTKKTVLANLIDRNLNYDDGEVSRSLILRSNNSFVFWYTQEESEGSPQEKYVYDGNWQLTSLSQNKAVLKIFGKKLHLTTEYRPYKGRKESKNVTIFSDILTVDSKTIKAKKIFSALEI